MTKLVRSLVPALIAAVLHIGLRWLDTALRHWTFAESQVISDHWYTWLAPWVGVLAALLPGFVCGYLSARRPLVNGATGVFVGAVIFTSVWESWWTIDGAVWLAGLVVLHGLQAAPFGMAGAATGYLFRHMSSNYVFKPTAGEMLRSSGPLPAGGGLTRRWSAMRPRRRNVHSMGRGDDG